MLHTKVHGNPSTCSKEEDLWAWKPSGHVTKIIHVLTYFHFLVPISLNTKFGKKGQVVSEKKKDLILICK